MWPDWDSWFSIEALVATAIIVVPVIIGAVRHDVKWFAGALILGVLAWYSGAVVAQQRTKPDRDFVYFIPSLDPRDAESGRIALLSVASGPLRDVRMAIQTTEANRQNKREYLFSHHFTVFDEGIHLIGISLPPGDFTFDSDTPSTLGKIRERLQLTLDENGKFAPPIIRVWRKGTGEVLIPEPQHMPASAKAAMGLFVLVMATFGIPLLWVSISDKTAKPTASEGIELSPAIVEAHDGLHPAKYIQVSVRAVGNLLGCQTVLESVSRIDGTTSTVVYNQPLNAGWSGTPGNARDINEGQVARANLFSVSYIAGLNGYALIPQTVHQDRALHQAVNPIGLYELTVQASAKTSRPATKKFRLRWSGALKDVSFWEPSS